MEVLRKHCTRCNKITASTLDSKHCAKCFRPYDIQNIPLVPCLQCSGHVPINANYCGKCDTAQSADNIPSPLIALVDEYELDETRISAVISQRLGKEFQGVKLKAGHIVKVLLAIAKAQRSSRVRCYIRAVDHVRRDLGIIILILIILKPKVPRCHFCHGCHFRHACHERHGSHGETRETRGEGGLDIGRKVAL